MTPSWGRCQGRELGVAPQPATGESSRSLGAPSLHFCLSSPLLTSPGVCCQAGYGSPAGFVNPTPGFSGRESVLPAGLDSGALYAQILSFLPSFFLPPSSAGTRQLCPASGPSPRPFPPAPRTSISNQNSRSYPRVRKDPEENPRPRPARHFLVGTRGAREAGAAAWLRCARSRVFLGGGSGMRSRTQSWVPELSSLPLSGPNTSGTFTHRPLFSATGLTGDAVGCKYARKHVFL